VPALSPPVTCSVRRATAPGGSPNQAARSPTDCAACGQSAPARPPDPVAFAGRSPDCHRGCRSTVAGCETRVSLAMVVAVLAGRTAEKMTAEQTQRLRPHFHVNSNINIPPSSQKMLQTSRPLQSHLKLQPDLPRHHLEHRRRGPYNAILSRPAATRHRSLQSSPRDLSRLVGASHAIVGVGTANTQRMMRRPGARRLPLLKTFVRKSSSAGGGTRDMDCLDQVGLWDPKEGTAGSGVGCRACPRAALGLGAGILAVGEALVA
jgi:hypothetical protein